MNSETHRRQRSISFLNKLKVNLSAGTTAAVHFGDLVTGPAQIADPAVTKYGSPTVRAVQVLALIDEDTSCLRFQCPFGSLHADSPH